MVIQSSNVAMRTDYRFSRRAAELVSYTGWGEAVKKAEETAATTPTAKDSAQEAGNAREWLMGMAVDSDRLYVKEEDDAVYSGEEKIEYGSFKNLMMLMSGQQTMESRKLSPSELLEKLMRRYQERLERIVASLGLNREETGLTGNVQNLQKLNPIALVPTQNFGNSMNLQTYYHEEEHSAFYSAGSVVTADGREIEFDISAEMSRSFTEYSQVHLDYGAAQLMDPLVIQLKQDAAQVSDQKFLFDIDSDGELDNISLLARGCGFLALDRNGDGEINDGSELFGTKSGNGFADLAVFDMDGNGWIDENDEVFNRLRVWMKDDAGNDKLVALGVAGVGAIYLGSASTAFSLNSVENNKTNAVVRESGVYLHEDGTAGVIRQMDFAVE